MITKELLLDKLENLKEEYEKRRQNTYCRRTETSDCDSCRADHYLEARLGAVDRCMQIVQELDTDIVPHDRDIEKEMVRDGYFGFVTWECPTCHHTLNLQEPTNYCCKCGQKLK